MNSIEHKIRDTSEIIYIVRRIQIQKQQKNPEIEALLQKRGKGAMVKAYFVGINDMDAPSGFFFNLERTVARRKLMACLWLPDGRMTTDSTEMRKHTVDFYTNVFDQEVCHMSNPV